MNIINTYLKAKHWQLFLAFFAPIILGQLIFFSSFFENMYMVQNAELIDHMSDDEIFEVFLDLFSYFKYFFLIVIASSLILSFWNWSITIGLQEKIPEDLRINLTKFKIFFFVPLLYATIICLLVFYLFEKIPDFKQLIEEDNFNEIEMEEQFLSMIKFFPLFLLFHFFTIFCSFHTLFFTAKTIKLAELKRKIKFDNFIGEFFLLWFNIIGIWILQPRINKLADE